MHNVTYSSVSSRFKIDTDDRAPTIVDATERHVTLLDVCDSILREMTYTGTEAAKSTLSKDLRSEVMHRQPDYTYIKLKGRYSDLGKQSVRILILENATHKIIKDIPVGAVLIGKDVQSTKVDARDPIEWHYSRYSDINDLVLCAALPTSGKAADDKSHSEHRFFTLFGDGRAALWDGDTCTLAKRLPDQRLIHLAGVINDVFWICHQEVKEGESKKDEVSTKFTEIRYYDLQTLTQIGRIALVDPGKRPACSNKTHLFVFSQAQVFAYSLNSKGHQEVWNKKIFDRNVCSRKVNDEYLAVNDNEFGTGVPTTWKALDVSNGATLTSFQIQQNMFGDSKVYLDGHHVIWVRPSTKDESASKRIQVVNLRTRSCVGNLGIHLDAFLSGVKLATTGDLVCVINTPRYLLRGSDAHQSTSTVETFRAEPMLPSRFTLASLFPFFRV